MFKKRIIQFSSVKKHTLFSLFLLFFSLMNMYGQSYYTGKLIKYKKSYLGTSLTIYKFSRISDRTNRVKVKYFAHNANSRFNSWKKGKDVLLACSGAFSENWKIDSPPHGLCVDNGDIVNRNLVIGKDKHGNSLDGLVIVYGGGADAGGIAIKDIEYGEICTPQKCYDIKDSYSDRISFISWADNNDATVFQLPLMFTNEYGKNYGSLYYGEKKERRYIAICKGSDGLIYHLIIDVAEDVYMNKCADNIRKLLNENFDKIYGILVLDTGGKNILYEYMNGYDAKIADTDISKATNLLIYYID